MEEGKKGKSTVTISEHKQEGNQQPATAQTHPPEEQRPDLVPEQHLSPFPPAKELKKLHAIDPELHLVDRVVTIAEKEQEHQHALNSKHQEALALNDKRIFTERLVGQCIGAILSLGALAATTAFAYFGATKLAAFFGTGMLGAIGFLLHQLNNNSKKDTEQ